MDNNNNNNTNTSRHRHKASSRSTSPVRSAPYQLHPPPTHTPSRWQQLVVSASSAAGTTAAVISEDSMKCLKYCLSWLQYAVKHIEQQMALLKNYLVSLASSKPSSSSTLTHNNKKNSTKSSVLSDIKKDIVDTLRKVVEVISRYAGSSLPVQARQTVRGFILNLPGRWATVNEIRSTATSPAASPMLSPSTSSGTSTPTQDEAAIRLLSFGQESVEMLQSVTTVFSDTVDRAELWIDRLKMMPGINQQQRPDESIRLPPIRTFDPPDHSPFDHNQKVKLDR
ncbi:hypothetical protein K501DRAFT_215660 [Backusella circina FSU 941]|nr:hypothetical protein K501DRAFT_215660 [Backusella circina FSU 941]